MQVSLGIYANQSRRAWVITSDAGSAKSVHKFWILKSPESDKVVL
jgi:hypothetical protein